MHKKLYAVLFFPLKIKKENKHNSYLIGTREGFPRSLESMGERRKNMSVCLSKYLGVVLNHSKATTLS